MAEYGVTKLHLNSFLVCSTIITESVIEKTDCLWRGKGDVTLTRNIRRTAITSLARATINQP